MKRAAWASSRIKLAARSAGILALWVIGGGSVVLAMLLLVMEPAGSTSSAERFTHAQRWIEPLTTTDWSTKGFAELAMRRPDFSASHWDNIALPDVIPLPPRTDAADTTPMARAWFRLRYQAPADLNASESVAIFIPRIMGGAWAVWANGQLVTNNANDWRLQWNRPMYVSLPLQISRPGAVIDIDLAVPFRVTQGYAVGSAWVGPQSAIAPRYARRIMTQQTLPAVGLVVILLLGIWSFHFWCLRRTETQHLFLALAALAWFVFDTQYFYDLESSAAGAKWFAAIVDASVSWLFLFLYLFATRINNLSFPRIEVVLACYAAGDLLLTLPVWGWQVNGLLLQHWLQATFCVLITLHISWFAAKSMRRDMFMLSASLWALLIMGIHDLVYTTGQADPDAFDFVAYGMFGVFLAFLYANQRRYFEALNEVEHSNEVLNARLAEREAELQANYQRLVSIEQQQTLLLERQRLMQDMHDGIGSSLMSSLAMVEKGTVSPERMAGLLRECIDELRLVIHSLEPIAHDLATLLASLRQRLGRRLEASGIHLQWEMDDLPPLPWLEAPQALQVLRIMQELLTNVVKHAHATQVSICSRLETPPNGTLRVLVSVTDNGIGFDPATVERGRGLNNIQQRADKLGCALYFDSESERGTSVKLCLPVAPTP